jgi:TP901 family phage tail tape measure protein
MNIGVLTVGLGIDASAATVGMTAFQRQLLTAVNRMNVSLATMVTSMQSITGAAGTMGTLTAKSMSQIVISTKMASTGVADFTTKVNAANAAAATMKATTGAIGGGVLVKGGMAISSAEISNVVSEKSAIKQIATSNNVTRAIVNNAITQKNAELRCIQQREAAFTKMHARAIAEDIKRTQIVNLNRIKEAYAEADAATKRIMAFNRMHERAIAEDIKRTRIAQANAAKIAAANKFSIDSFTTSLSNYSQKFRTFGYLATAMVTLPMVMAAKATFNMAKDYEYAMQKIVGLTGVAQSTVNAWSDEILKMGPRLGRMPQELVDALYFISSSGIKGTEAMNVLELSAKAAASGLGETKDVADILTSALNAYAGTGKTAAYYTDVLVAAVRVGKAEASSFATAIGQLIPFAAEAGVSFDQIAGGMAAITLTGSSAANAAVYLKGVFNALIQAGDQGSKSLESVGLTFADLRKTLATGPEGLINVMQKFRDVQIALGDEAVKDVLPNIRSLNAFMSIAGKNFQYNTKIMREVTNAGGSLSAAWAAVADTIKIKYDQAISQANVSMITLGKSVATSFLPMLESLVKKLGQITERFNLLSETEKHNKLVKLAWIAAAGPISLALSIIGYTVSGLISVLGGLWSTLKYGRLIILALTGSTKALSGAMAMNTTLTTLLLSPYGAVLLAVGALVAIYIRLKKAINEATEAGEREKAFRETEKQIQSTEKGFKDKLGLIPDMDESQLNAFRDEANQKLVILKDARLELTTLRKKWQEEDQTYLGLQNQVAMAEKALANTSGKAYASYAKLVTNAKQAVTNYIQEYATGLDTSVTALDKNIKEVEDTIKSLSDMIEEFPEDPVLKAMAEAEAAKEKLKVHNKTIEEIVQNLKDEEKYIDATALVMKSLGIEYNATDEKGKLFLEGINKLTKEGLPFNSKEVQALINKYKALGIEVEKARIELEKEHIAITKWYLEQDVSKRLKGFGLTTEKTPTATAPMDYQKFLMKTVNYTAGLQTFEETLKIADESLARTKVLASELTNIFSNMFMSIGTGWDNVVNKMIDGLKRLVAEILARIAVFAILTLISGGTGGLAAGAGSLIKGGLGKFLFTGLGRGMAGGGTVPSGYPNDTFHARLSSGETVFTPSQLGQLINRSARTKIEVTVNGEIKGRDLALVLRRVNSVN